ncbi:sugar phosphate isomerase/epimerase [Thiohalocapsa sp. ML1]|uniref:sugar phosphate isomerase/epimerase family protein n=1 Tax=Thiohalocapsa sp. ML1 TaxID=1431688 RepID=UPI0007321DC1|nr:TIM barrel protein [Thiohalocapsa sp. ML1]
MPSPKTAHPRFGFKVVDRARAEASPMVERALAEGRPIEIGLYFENADCRAYLRDTLAGAAIPVTVHLDHRRLSLVRLSRASELLDEQLSAAATLGARRVLTHIAPYPLTPSRHRWPALWGQLTEWLSRLDRRAAEHGLGLLIENTFHSLGFYRDFAAVVLAAAGPDTGLCFDIGHAKVWSDTTLAAWLGFLAEVDNAGRPLHCHLHANDGLYDRHLSFADAERDGLTVPDSFTGTLDGFAALAAIDVALPMADKIFEVPPEQALTNLDLILTRLAEV